MKIGKIEGTIEEFEWLSKEYKKSLQNKNMHNEYLFLLGFIIPFVAVLISKII